MSLGTIVLVCLAALFFGGIVALDRINRRKPSNSADAGMPSATTPPAPANRVTKDVVVQSTISTAKVTPLSRPKRSQTRGVSGEQAKHGT